MRIRMSHNAPSLGLVASGKRNIRSGFEFNHLYPAAHQLERTDPIIDDSDTYRTLEIMEDYARKYKADTAKITEFLRKGRNINTQRNAILKDLWEHVYNHFQYKEDKPGIEQIRRPARSWHDRQSGIDCDCMSVVFSTMLLNMGIPHAFRKAKYKGDWQHVYVVVPKSNTKSLNNRQNYYVLDAVVDSYDYEVPFSKKHDKAMKIQGLNGLDDAQGTDNEFNNLNAFGFKPSRANDEYAKEYNAVLTGIGNVQSDQAKAEAFLRATKKHLQNTRNVVAENAELYSNITGRNPQQYIKELNYAISNWDNPVKRQIVLNELAASEEALNGWLGDRWSAVKDAVSNVTNAVGQGAEWVGDKVRDGAGAVIRSTGASMGVKAAILLAFKSNTGRIGRLGYAYWTESQARNAGMPLSYLNQIKEKLKKVEGIYKTVNGFRFDANDQRVLKESILQGWRKERANNPEDHGLGLIRTSRKITSTSTREPISTTTREPIVREPIVREPIVREPIVREPIVREPIVKDTKAPISTVKNDVLVSNATPQQLLNHVKRGGKFRYSFNKGAYNHHNFIDLKKRFQRSPLAQASAYVGSAKKRNGTVQLLDQFERVDRGQFNEIMKDYSVKPEVPIRPLPEEQPVKIPTTRADQPVKPTVKTPTTPKPKPLPAPSQDEMMQTTALEPKQAGGNTGLIIGGLLIATGIAYYSLKGDQEKPSSTKQLSGTSAKKTAKRKPRKKAVQRKKSSGRNKKMTL